MIPKKLFLYPSVSDSEVDTLHRILSKTDSSLLNEGINYLGRLGNLSKVNRTNRLSEETVDSVQSELAEAFKKSGNQEIHTYILTDQILKNYSNPDLAASFQKTVLAPFSLDLEIVFFLKRQDFFLESSFSKMILNNNSTISFEEYLDQFEKSDLDWHRLLKGYSETFGKENIHVHEFKRSYFIEKRDFIRHFGSLVGSNCMKNYLGSISENNFSTDVLKTIRLANHHMHEGEWQKLHNLFENTSHIKNENSFFTDQQRVNFLKKYDNSNKKIAEEYVKQERDVFFTNSNTLKKNEDEDKLLTESLTVAFTKAVLDLKNRTDEVLLEQKKKHPLEKSLMNIWFRIRSILKI